MNATHVHNFVARMMTAHNIARVHANATPLCNDASQFVVRFAFDSRGGHSDA
jgi:hypothetical protein